MSYLFMQQLHYETSLLKTLDWLSVMHPISAMPCVISHYPFLISAMPATHTHQTFNLLVSRVTNWMVPLSCYKSASFLLQICKMNKVHTCRIQHLSCRHLSSTLASPPGSKAFISFTCETRGRMLKDMARQQQPHTPGALIVKATTHSNRCTDS